MAAEDLTREGSNMKKRGVSVAVSDLLTGTQIASTGCIPFTLPKDILIIAAYMQTTVVSGDSDTIDIQVGSDTLVNEISAETLGKSVGTPDLTKTVRTTEDDVTVLDGAAGVTTTYRGYCVVEYVERTKTNGELTNISMS